MDIIIRHATLEDTKTILEIAKEQYDNSNLPFPMEMDEAHKNIEGFIIQGQKTHLLLVAEQDGEIIGALGAYISSPLFSTRKVGIECLWYVKQEYRKTKAGLELNEAYCYWAKLVGATHIYYGNVIGSVDLSSLYTKIGAEKVEELYIKELP